MSKLDNIQGEFASVEEIVESQRVIVVFDDCNCNRGLYVRSFELNIYAQNGKLISSIESQSESLTSRQKRQLKLLETEQLIEITDIKAVAPTSPILKLDDIVIQIK